MTTLIALVKHLEEYNKEIGCDGSKIGSHNLQSHVYLDDGDNLYEFDLNNSEPTSLLGCGCWDGVVLKIIKRED